MERLQKIIASSGISSRRGAEQLILTGKVSLNGHIVRELGIQADPSSADIRVHGKPLPKPKTVTYAVNKPRGYVCSRVKQGNEPLVTELVPNYPPVYPVGRLDKESEGLILLTNDGTLANTLSHPSFEHEKEYRVTCNWRQDQPGDLEKAIRLLEKGVRLGDGLAKVDSVHAEMLPPQSIALQIIVHEGRHHLIRRICAVVGLKVKRLVRTRIGSIQLKGIKSGGYRILQQREITLIHGTHQTHPAPAR